MRLRRPARPPGRPERRRRHQAARHRRVVVLRDVRPGAVPRPRVAELLGRWLGGGDGAGAADGQGAGRHRHRPRTARATRPSWSMIVAEKLGISPDDVDVLHSDTAISPLGLDTYGSRSLPVGGVAIAMACDKVIDKAALIAAHQLEASADDLEFAGGCVHGQGLARQDDAAGRDRLRGVHRPQPARRPRAQPRGGRHLRPAELLVALRHAHLRGRGGHRDRRRRRPAVRRRRRLRRAGQPADRRRAGARRCHPGPRPGAVRGGRLRRRRQPQDEHAGRVPRAGGQRRARAHPRAHRHPVADQPARRQGHRRGRHHRRRPGRHQRHRRRPLRPRRPRHPDAGQPAQRVERHPRRRAARRRRARGRHRPHHHRRSRRRPPGGATS